MAAMGAAQNVEEEENVRGVGAKSVQSGLGQETSQGLLAGSSRTTARSLGSGLTWNMSSAEERETRIAAALNAWRREGASQLQF